jgi:hypothetical protein
MNKYALTDFSTYYSDVSQECTQAHTNTFMPMENNEKQKYCYFHRRASVRPVIFTGGLLSALSFLREGFCPPCHFHGRAFVRLVNFGREGFCPGGLLSYTRILIDTYTCKLVGLKAHQEVAGNKLYIGKCDVYYKTAGVQI